MYEPLFTLLTALDGIEQDRKFHPEGDALFHSLQVFEHSRTETDDWELVMTALLHDVGKAIDCQHHAEIGAQLLVDLAPPRVIWLVNHHLDLLKFPTKTRRRLAGTSELQDLEQLRRWDVAGRKVKAWVSPPEDALAFLMNMINSNQRQFDDCSAFPTDTNGGHY